MSFLARFDGVFVVGSDFGIKYNGGLVKGRHHS